MAETRRTAATVDTAETTVAAPAGHDGLYLGDAIHFFLSAKRAGAARQCLESCGFGFSTALRASIVR